MCSSCGVVAPEIDAHEPVSDFGMVSQLKQSKVVTLVTLPDDLHRAQLPSHSRGRNLLLSELF